MIKNLKFRFNQFQKIFSNAPDIIGLNTLLQQFEPDLALPERMDLVRQLFYWLLGNDPDQVDARFRYLFKILNAHPEWNSNLASSVNRTLNECRTFRLFTEIGVKVDAGLWGDIATRLLAKVIGPGDRHDIAQIFLETFTTDHCREALKSLSPELVEPIYVWFERAMSGSVKEKLTAERKDAIYFLVAHIAHYGLSSAMQRRVARPYDITNSPFFLLRDAIRHLDKEQANHTLKLCEDEVSSVYSHLDLNGVSVDVVNRLDTIGALLHRVRVLLNLQSPTPQVVHQFTIEVVNAQKRGRSVLGYIHRNFYLLSRKVVERNGHSGVHYIAHSKSELNIMFWSALGGGLIVVGMTIFKIMLMNTHPAPIFLATGIWVIYSIGFLSMQFTGSTLATKIPSFTASRLAGILRSTKQINHSAFRKEVRSTLKSQLIALLGNFCGVIPFALLLDQIFRYLFGVGLMNNDYASHIIKDLNPILTFAIPLGALTGLQLWLSSLAGGWFENWVIFNRIPEIIEEHYRLRKILGEGVAIRLANWLKLHSSGIATNVSLGFLFGFTPLFGGIFGLGLNSHHVTISTASAMFAVSELDFQLAWKTVVAFISGLLLIGLMNFLVSFALALFIAAKARKMQFWRMLYYLRRSL